MRVLISLLTLLAPVLMALPITALAQPPSSFPTSADDLAGSWTYSREASGYVYLDQLELNPGKDGVSGGTTYMDNGAEQHELFRSFAITGSEVAFLSERPDGTLVRHEGEFTEDGLSIRGRYELGMGVGGPFVLARAGQGCPPLANARWHLALRNLEGATVDRADGGLLGDTTGFVKGSIYFDDGSYTSKTVEGSVTADGSLDLAIYGSTNYTLRGTFSADNALVTGEWTDSKGRSGTFSLDRQ